MSGGIQADISAGTLVARRAGPSMTMEQGTLTAAANDVTISLGGEEASAETGTLGWSLRLEGEEATSESGTATPSITLALSGSSSASSAGTIGVSQSADDTFATTESGTLSLEVAPALSGKEATGSQGTLSVTNVVLSGQLALVQQYTLSTRTGRSIPVLGQGMAMGQGDMASSGGIPYIPEAPEGDTHDGIEESWLQPLPKKRKKRKEEEVFAKKRLPTIEERVQELFQPVEPEVDLEELMAQAQARAELEALRVKKARILQDDAEMLMMM